MPGMGETPVGLRPPSVSPIPGSLAEMMTGADFMLETPTRPSLISQQAAVSPSMTQRVPTSLATQQLRKTQNKDALHFILFSQLFLSLLGEPQG